MKFEIVFVVCIGVLLFSCSAPKEQEQSIYQHEQTKELVDFVSEAVQLVEKEGETAFPEFREKEGRWFQDDLYIFIWGLDGMRYVYPPDLSGEGQNMIDLKDVNDKQIGRMFVDAVSSEKGAGWVFYQWPKPGGKKPIWKSTYLKKAITSDGKEFLVGSGLYNMKTEKVFIVDAVNDAVDLLQKDGLSAIPKIASKESKFIFLDSYVYIKDMHGNEILNPKNPDLEGKNIYDLQDANGKYFVKEELEILQTQADCWMDYMWPKPGETEPSKKVVYVKKVVVEQDTLVVGCGYYPASEKDKQIKKIITTLNEAAIMITNEGEKVFPEFRKKNSKWFQDDFYIFIYDTDGNRIVYPPAPQKEGENAFNVTDADGKYQVQMFIEKALSEQEEGWVQYKWPKKGESTPVPKHTFVKKAQTPSGKILVLCAGYYPED
ncbi:MAG: cache domain-containing protein [Armatimonadetes bacterium]|nr:cache domain-containing protein [Armatimonadota bacterium]